MKHCTALSPLPPLSLILQIVYNSSVHGEFTLITEVVTSVPIKCNGNSSQRSSSDTTINSVFPWAKLGLTCQNSRWSKLWCHISNTTTEKEYFHNAAWKVVRIFPITFSTLYQHIFICPLSIF